ncbi:MAG: GNAT family N-acetyltransferase [Promethearchaeota archaeon]
MKIESREYNPKEDFDKLMQFLINTYNETKTLQNWFPDRFESNHDDWIPDIRIWEEINDMISPPHHKIVAFVIPERTFNYFIQIHPDYSFLEKEIINWIEIHCTAKKKELNEKQTLSIITVEGNIIREQVLTELGFKQLLDPIYGHLRIRPLDLPIRDYSLPEGFEIRSVQGKSDYEKLAEGVRLIFGHGDWFTAEIIEGIINRSFYKQDLDLVVVAPDGAIAAFCTFRIDPVSRITQLEPMGTHPKFRRLGLAKALLSEGLKRLEKYNPTLLYIGGAADNPAAMRLYESVGFTKKLTLYFWVKDI